MYVIIGRGTVLCQLYFFYICQNKVSLSLVNSVGSVLGHLPVLVQYWAWHIAPFLHGCAWLIFIPVWLHIDGMSTRIVLLSWILVFFYICVMPNTNIASYCNVRTYLESTLYQYWCILYYSHFKLWIGYIALSHLNVCTYTLRTHRMFPWLKTNFTPYFSSPHTYLSQSYMFFSWIYTEYFSK